MPKVKPLTAAERQDRELLAALRAGQARKGETDRDTAQVFPDKCEHTYRRRIKKPQTFTLNELRVLARHYDFTDLQLCLMFGVEYHGSTPA